MLRQRKICVKKSRGERLPAMEKGSLNIHTHSISLSCLKNLRAQRLGTLSGKNLFPMSPDCAQLCPLEDSELVLVRGTRKGGREHRSGGDSSSTSDPK